LGETDVEGNHFKMGVDDWDIIRQCTTSLMTVSVVVKQEEDDKYPTNKLIHDESFRGCSYQSDLTGHWKRVERISRVIIA
jgi:hypothetical protein